MDIKALNESARQVLGSDLSILVARHESWGSADNLVMIYGRQHELAAAIIACAAGAHNRNSVVVGTGRTPDFLGAEGGVYSTVQWAASPVAA